MPSEALQNPMYKTEQKSFLANPHPLDAPL